MPNDMETCKVDSDPSGCFDVVLVEGGLVMFVYQETKKVPELYRSVLDGIVFWNETLKQASWATPEQGTLKKARKMQIPGTFEDPYQAWKATRDLPNRDLPKLMTFPLLRYVLSKNVLDDMIFFASQTGFEVPSLLRINPYFGYIQGTFRETHASLLYSIASARESVHVFETKRLGRVAVTNGTHVLISFESPKYRRQGFYMIPVTFLFESRLFPAYRYPGKAFLTLPNPDQSMGFPVEKYLLRWEDPHWLEKFTRIYTNGTESHEERITAT